MFLHFASLFLNRALQGSYSDVIAFLRSVGEPNLHHEDDQSRAEGSRQRSAQIAPFSTTAAAARLAGKEPSDIIDAAMEGDVGRIADHLAVDPSRVNLRDG